MSNSLSQNNLSTASSPYLIQHQDNPVHWQVWSNDTLEAAKQAGKPILLSIGYAACHWCHVMAHESFENPDIAAQMNQDFTCIKVDREEHPEVDMIYQQSLALLGQQGGWPLTMFLTPDAEPYWGGTYFAPSDQHGRPGFPRVMVEMARIYHQDKAQLTKNRDAIKEALTNLQNETGGQQQLSRGALTPISQRLCKQTDPFYGGFGDAPKFPNTFGLDLLWRAYLREGDTPYHRAVVEGLAAMSQGGLYDHLGGGYHRYSVDAKWLVPHFEKMLYDNAALLQSMAQVYAVDPLPLFQARMTQTADFILREMQRPEGGFGATYDADSPNDKGENEEGAFYTWSMEDVSALLGPDDGAAFCVAYDVTRNGNFEGRAILNRLAHKDDYDLVDEARLAPLRAKLLAARADRIAPGYDDKVLADWNGYMISALVAAGTMLDRADYIDAAIRAFTFVRDEMGTGDALTHAWRDGRTAGNEVLTDYAAMVRAALSLYEATQDGDYLAQARRWTDHVITHYWLEEQKGFAMTPATGSSLIVRPRTGLDDATPSGNGMMMGNLARLIMLADKVEDQARFSTLAQEMVTGFSAPVLKNLQAGATFINGLDAATRGLSLIVVGPQDDDATNALLMAARKSAAPDRVIIWVADGAALPPFHPAQGKTMIDGAPALYICVGQSCTAPITDVAQVAGHIRTLLKEV
ncbi:MAG: thioredoxin domain-containing protein [Alphaproteobacteria bacterium]